MTHRGRTLAQYNVQELRDLFLEMFCATRTAVDNPMMQPSGMAKGRSFLVMDEGEIDGTTGSWAEDEDDGAEGFLEALEDVFWVYDDTEYTWYQRRFQGRKTRRTKKSANPQNLIDAVRSGTLKEVDSHPPFRSLLEHKAFHRSWLPTVCSHVDFRHDVFLLGVSLRDSWLFFWICACGSSKRDQRYVLFLHHVWP